MSFQIVKPEGSLGRVELNDTLDPNIDGFATVWSTGSHHAPLLAASRDLLEALKNMVSMYVELSESCNASSWDASIDKEVIEARAAIAKAEGAA